jgi:hypothetical protein
VNKNYLKKVSDKIIQQLGLYMKKCVFVFNNSLHQLKIDASAQYQYYNSFFHLN